MSCLIAAFCRAAIEPEISTVSFDPRAGVPANAFSGNTTSLALRSPASRIRSSIWSRLAAIVGSTRVCATAMVMCPGGGAIFVTAPATGSACPNRTKKVIARIIFYQFKVHDPLTRRGNLPDRRRAVALRHWRQALSDVGHGIIWPDGHLRRDRAFAA